MAQAINKEAIEILREYAKLDKQSKEYKKRFYTETREGKLVNIAKDNASLHDLRDWQRIDEAKKDLLRKFIAAITKKAKTQR